ncbi:hypothetical protein Glove_92g71 [Diversispora epigaea]|uniref:Uncharacterized protein n=1 Tax=Diversispora epigaea TaxID=1348612 RepID=A0A397JFT3_9GLOM|nr:hypothetical protein Glove_92g71 [Diversispora epigaea]
MEEKELPSTTKWRIEVKDFMRRLIQLHYENIEQKTNKYNKLLVVTSIPCRMQKNSSIIERVDYYYKTCAITKQEPPQIKLLNELISGKNIKFDNPESFEEKRRREKYEVCSGKLREDDTLIKDSLEKSNLPIVYMLRESRRRSQ